MKIIFLLFFVFLFGCSTTVHIKTNPSGAKLSLIEGSRVVDLGTSPVSIKEKEIARKLGTQISAMNYYKVVASKESVFSEPVLIPIGSWGNRSTTVMIPLNVKDAGAKPDLVIKHILNAQKFAENKQLIKSHDELDEALKLSPKFSYAMSMKAALYYANKEFQKSKEWYTKALQTDPGNTEALMMLQELKESQASTN